MSDTTIRLATPADIDDIMRLIEEGRKKMMDEGNTRQWANGHPRQEVVEDDIKRGNSYLLTTDDGIPLATFALMAAPDPTYTRIDGGSWLNDEPYYVIHRIASSAKARGVMRQVIAYALTKTRNIRIDTHEDNQTMRALLTKYGFVYCGIIYLANGDERLAFQLTDNQKSEK